MSTIHVVVVHYNTPELTAELLRSLPARSSSGRAVIVHVVDNMSLPQHREALRSVATEVGARLVLNNSNVGFGQGVNGAVDSPAVSDDDLVWLLNPDAIPDAGCLETLEREVDRGEHAMVSPLILMGDRDDPRVWFAGGLLDMVRMKTDHVGYGQPPGQMPLGDVPIETEYLTGAAPMMRVRTFRSLGGFADDYFLYWEDVDLSWRLRSRGATLVVVPGATVWHAEGASSGGGRSSTFFYWTCRNRLVFAKQAGAGARTAFWGRGLIESLSLVVRAFREHERRPAKLAAALRGTLHGIAYLAGRGAAEPGLAPRPGPGERGSSRDSRRR